KPHHKHLTRTTVHIVAHREQVQKRVLWALGQPIMEQVIGALQHTGQALSATRCKSSAVSNAANCTKCTGRAAATSAWLATPEPMRSSPRTVEITRRWSAGAMVRTA